MFGKVAWLNENGSEAGRGGGGKKGKKKLVPWEIDMLRRMAHNGDSFRWRRGRGGSLKKIAREGAFKGKIDTSGSKEKGGEEGSAEC